MPTNPVKGFQDRFMQKPEGIVYMDLLCCGRKTLERPAGSLHHQMGMRTGFFSGRINIGSVPNACIKKQGSPHNPEGVTWILPFQKGSIGWKLFRDLPLAKMAELEDKLNEMEVFLAHQIEAAQDMSSPARLKELLYNVYDMFSGWKKDVQMPEQLNIQQTASATQNKETKT